MFINVAKGSLKKILNKNEDENNTSIQLSLSNAKVSQQKNNKCC